jgi:AraC-like DNA-binding protein
MKLKTQKIPTEQSNSFIVQAITSETFNIGRHQHIENELILFTKGSGVAIIGDYEGKFDAGDIYFIGSNLPHSFQNGKDAVSAVIVQFQDNCWGNYFMNLSECMEIRMLFEIATYGLQLIGNTKHHLNPIIKALEKVTGINRIIFLLHCLQTMISEKEYVMLSKKKAQALNNINGIEKVLDFTLTFFNEPISLSQVTAVACMSIPSFCLNFKQCTGKTYIDYLNEIRINYACQLLLETSKPVNEICYESGYNTVAHFHRQFLKLRKITPLQYRNTCPTEVINDLLKNTHYQRVA